MFKINLRSDYLRMGLILIFLIGCQRAISTSQSDPKAHRISSLRILVNSVLHYHEKTGKSPFIKPSIPRDELCLLLDKHGEFHPSLFRYDDSTIIAFNNNQDVNRIDGIAIVSIKSDSTTKAPLVFHSVQEILDSPACDPETTFFMGPATGVITKNQLQQCQMLLGPTSANKD